MLLCISPGEQRAGQRATNCEYSTLLLVRVLLAFRAPADRTGTTCSHVTAVTYTRGSNPKRSQPRVQSRPALGPRAIPDKGPLSFALRPRLPFRSMTGMTGSIISTGSPQARPLHKFLSNFAKQPQISRSAAVVSDRAKRQQ